VNEKQKGMEKIKTKRKIEKLKKIGKQYFSGTDSLDRNLCSVYGTEKNIRKI
jgi:hypothetical protein